MTLAEMRAAVAVGESDTLELKATIGQRTEAARTVCGMLNRDGGVVLFGVRNDGALMGQTLGDRTLEDVVGELRKIEPYVPISPETVPLHDGLVVIVLNVPQGRDRPYTYDGRAYVRQSRTTSAMPRDHFDRLLTERKYRDRRWEERPAYRIGPRDLDAAEVTRTVEAAIQRGRMDEPGTRDPVSLLVALDLIQDSELLNAAVALFATPARLRAFYPQCVLRMARFRGTTKSEFLDNRQVVGGAFALFAQAQRFLREHLPIAGRVVPHLFERADDPLYPLEALREALANAICHRDYAVEGGAITLALFDDRLEISSTGALPDGLSPADLKRPHTSRPWNPLVAGVLYQRGLVEQWGRGTLKIVSLIEQAGLAEPDFEEAAGDVVVRFFPTGYVPPSRVEHDLTPLQQRLLLALSEGAMSRSDLQQQYLAEVPERVVKEALQHLKRLGLVRMTGRTKGARWSLK